MPPTIAVMITDQGGTGRNRPPSSANTSTVIGTVIDPINNSAGKKFKFRVLTMAHRTSRYAATPPTRMTIQASRLSQGF